jgi:hypothetical protein
MKSAPGGGLAHHVGSLAAVGATVLGVGVQDVQGHEAKVVGSSEPMALRNWLAIAEPLNL